MKNLLRIIAAQFLALLSRMILRKYKPQIVMVTGSVGKTSTKDAVAAALSESFHLRASEKSYNSEFGVPLTIIGASNPWMSPVKWFGVIEEAIALILFPSHYPKLLVLEVGADRPGDLRRILSIATPDAVVVTRLPEVPVHVEAYASPEAVREEEFAPAYALAPGCPLIVSADDSFARELAVPLPATVTTYGTDASADIRFENVRVYEEDGKPAGMEADVYVEGTHHTLRAQGSLGRQQMYAPAAALALALALGMTTKDALQGILNYRPPSGRGRVLSGMKNSVIVDDSYNASPAATEEVLRSLSLVCNTPRCIAVLGDMLELGRYSMEEHSRIGTVAAETVDIVIGVGLRARAIADAAREAGKGEHEVFHFDDSHSAAAALPDIIRPGDIILIKGSQGVRTERITEVLLADPAHVSSLVRQEKEWKKR